MKEIKSIAILTSGGDAPGMNNSIRACVRAGLAKGLKVYGIIDGYLGLVNDNIIEMNRESVTNILLNGGTILGTARLEDFAKDEVALKGVENLKRRGIDALICVGGDGTYKGALKLSRMGINCVGVPGTIDNDIASSEYTIGFDTAVNTAVEAIDRLRDTCNSHNRCSVVEVMGRYCGDIAYASGIASGADLIVTSEQMMSDDEIVNFVLEANKTVKHKHMIIVITEHVTDVDNLAKRITKEAGFDARATVLGHIQRGGRPTPFDRILATRLTVAAVDALIDGKNGICMGIMNNEVHATPIEEALKMNKNVFKKYALYVNDLSK